ncbi:ASCH domain-containing protein [Bordetella bronchiseptica]|uniref:ASCH domain-containing protein n=1 Tax=Bordetella bronchiseptica TaxID=518 RepID=UPI001244A90F|nr:ASCH domain-containing protein [Bordetella bronchiseptica]KAB1444162.1 ASCH domain-containing protein [Bordetella bronchiseptica]KAB1569268.1 ASCH domain-containing protein [Bordetella bronchiseptica]
MADLHLALKGEYFDAIKAGTKVEEYRLCTPYWKKRLEIPFELYDRIVLTRGYPAKGDESRRLLLPWQGYSIKSITHPHFGPDPVMVYAIKVAQEDGNGNL